MKAKVQLTAGFVSLLALLAYTLVHTGGLLSHYVNPPWVGYVAAFGIELAVVSLSLRIGDLRRSRQSPGFFLFVLIAVVIVSAIANIAEGFSTLRDEQLTVNTVRELDAIQAIIGLAATGLISLIVLALSEIVGTDVEVTVKVMSRERKAAERQAAREALSTEELNAFPASIEHARRVKAERDATSKAERLNRLLDIYRQNPNAGPTQVGDQLGVSRTTVYSYLDELESEGVITRNGLGVKVNGQGVTG